MWLSVWKVVVAFLAFIGALVFLLFSTLVVLAVLQTTGERPAGQPEPVENLQYLVTGCGLRNGKIVSIDKRHDTSYSNDPSGGDDDSDAGYSINAYAMKLKEMDLRELSIPGHDEEPGWHQPRKSQLPYLSRSALQFYFAYVNNAKTTDWLPNESQVNSINYFLKVNRISFENGRVTNAGICLFSPGDNNLYVVNLNHW